MLEPPAIPPQQIITHIKHAYGLEISQVVFLPIGADVNTAVYRLVDFNGTAYYLKLRKGPLAEASIAAPQFLRKQGIQALIAPIETNGGHLWARMDAYTTILYPFIEGQDAWRYELSESQWIHFGAALRGIHNAQIPPTLSTLIPREMYTPRWRDLVKDFQIRVEHQVFEDAAASKMAALMRERSDTISHVVRRAGELALALQSQPTHFVLCHADIHAGNLLITPDGSLYIVDWDTLLMAPKERDLMFIGGGIGGTWRSKKSQELFYRGYGTTQLDLLALAYYRYERIVEDFAAFGEQLLLSRDGGDDREQGFRYFASSFDPDGELSMALQTDEQIAMDGLL